MGGIAAASSAAGGATTAALAATTGTAACTRQAARCLALGRTVVVARISTSTRSPALWITAILQASGAAESSAVREHAAKANQAGGSNLEFASLTHPSSSTFAPCLRYRMHEAHGEPYSREP